MIFVFGAGPVESITGAPRLILTANLGSYHLSSLRFTNTDSISLVSATLIEEGETSKGFQQLKNHGPFSKLIIRESRRPSILSLFHPPRDLASVLSVKELNELSTSLAFVDFRTLTGRLSALFGWPWLLSELFKSSSFRDVVGLIVAALRGAKGVSRFFHSLVASLPKIHISTGVLAVLLAAEEAIPGEEIHIFGVTASWSNYANGDPVILKGGLPAGLTKHLHADVRVLRRIVELYPKIQLVIQDSELRSLVFNSKNDGHPA